MRRNVRLVAAAGLLVMSAVTAVSATPVARNQQEAALLNIALSDAGDSFNNSFNESRVLGNLPAVQSLCNEVGELDKIQGQIKAGTLTPPADIP